MTKDGDKTSRFDHQLEKISNLHHPSIYLWQGFSGNISLSTFDVFSKINVKDIAFGGNHSLFLTEDGQVFVSGMNDMGQLGTGSLDVKVIKEPMKLLDVSDPVTQISCGKNHSAIITDSGHVFCWGSSKDGQCGTGSLDLVVSPAQVVVEVNNGFCQHGVIKPTIPEVLTNVSCGASHTLAVSSAGEVWAWGNGPQLGFGDLKHAPIPRRVDTLQGRTVVAVCCGDRHSMALVLRGERKPSKPSSVMSKGKSDTNSTITTDLNLSRCGMCNKEILTYTDTNDMCIIDDVHNCAIKDTVFQTDSTLVEEVTSSSSSETIKRLAAGSPEDGQYVPPTENESLNRLPTTKHVPPTENEALNRLATTKDEDMNNKNYEYLDNEGLLNDSSQLDTYACDTSVLVIPANSLFDEEDQTGHAVGDDDICSRVQPQLDSFITSSEVDRQANAGTITTKPSFITQDNEDILTSKITEVRTAESASESKHQVYSKKRLPEKNVCGLNQFDGQFMVADNAARDRTLSVESDDEIWKRRSESEDTDEEMGVFAQRSKERSSSTMTVKSLDLSGAREYLQRQFEDERVSPPGNEGLKTSQTLAATDSNQSSASLGYVFGYSSSMLAQVKSVTSKALTNIQGYSVFSSPRDPHEMKNVQHPHTSIEMSSLSEATTGYGQQTKQEARLKSQTSVKRSGTFIEWTREMAAVDDDPASLMKDSDQRSLRTIEMQQKNLNRATLSSKSGLLESQPPHQHVVTATDVWVWGCNDQGQLGLGDQLDRDQPTVVKMFMGRHVIKLAAGEKHSLALTANSQVYSWGSNSYGQLGQPDGVHAPTRIKFTKGFMAWDVAAGSYHSLFLGDSADAHPDILYCGRHPSIKVHSSVMKTNSPVSVAEVKQLHWVTKIMAGGPHCACKALDLSLPESGSVFELAASERTLYNQLIKTSNLLLRPLQRSNLPTLMEVYPFKPLLQDLIMTFGALTKKIGEGVTDLTRCIQNSAPLTHSLILGSHSEFMEAFRSYSHSFSDFLAVGGFDYCTKTGSEFFEKIQDSIKDLSDEQDKSVAASSLFLRAMRYPFFRLAEYSRIISRIAVLVASPETRTQLQSVVLDWDGLKISFSSEHKMADTTRMFWETATPKLTEAHRTPKRRVLRDSKTHPLQMPSGGKFTSRLFVLFNDIFLMQSTNMAVFPLETLWVESGNSVEDEHDNGIIILISPEEKLEVQASTPTQKTEWLIALNSAISKQLTNQKSISSKHASGERFTPPLIRHACHSFVKAGRFKDAVYYGTLLSGKVHGAGNLKWPDGSCFEGNFKKGLMHGSGTYTLTKSKGKEIQKGTWKDGKLNGLATVKYANGDFYEGFFQDDQRFGHGMYQSGHHKSTYASVYIGEWLQNLREGYGVQDDILKGEKYMGMWVEDHRHGSGVLVTLDGMYFEGTFAQNKLMGFGVMISDDNTLYEGDFVDITYLSGKGTLTLATGDKLEGSFTGTLNEGLKVNGTFIKSATSPDVEQRSHPAGVKSKHFGRLGVNADAKWTDIFSHVGSVLGQSDVGKIQSREDTYKAWEVVAVTVTAGRNALKGISGMSPSKQRIQEKSLEGLEKIPSHSMRSLNTQTVEEMSAYLNKACDCVFHPLGQLLETLVNVFRASYIGVGAHPRLLHHAVLEMKSYIRRLYRVIRILFPALPAKGGPIHVYPPSSLGDIARTTDEAKDFIEGLENEDANATVLTAAGLLYPILLPKIYPPLFDLYALYNEKNDDRYWERVSRLNRQSDMGLMAYLGIDQHFWLMEDILEQDKSQKLSTVKDVCYAEAVDTLQQLSTAFSPIEKLKIIEQTFNEITKTVTMALKDDHMWCMDDLFPIFQFVVVRAKIRHLGAEIHMVDDLIEPHLEHGEFGLMFTTLKACYFQIQNEKMPHH